jgi:protease IV
VRLQTTAFALALLAVGCEGRPRQIEEIEETTSAAEDHVAELDLRGGVPEEATVSFLAPARAESYADLLLRLRGLPSEPHVKGVFVRLANGIGFARAEEIGRLLARVRANGLPVVCHSHGYNNSTMLVAARACDEIWLSPAGSVDTIGVAAQLLFGRALLDRLEVKVDFLQVGKFKGAEEPFTRTSSSPEARQSLERALSGLRTAWIDGVEEGRGKSADALGLEDGPLGAQDAKSRGMIDTIGFERDARKHAIERAAVDGKVDYFGGSQPEGGGMAELVRALSGSAGSNVPHVAVLRATGGIGMSRGGGLLGGGNGISEADLGKEVRRLEKDESVKAVVLRIDSPGGSALASDLLWRALMDLRAQKPLVVSVGGMAASGGYYLACAGNKIVVERSSIIGSIGVVAGKLSFGATLREAGVNVESVAAKPGGDAHRALLASPFEEWDEATRARLHATITEMYDLFIARIAEGRSMTPEQIQPAAEGRVMGGDDAKAAGLVDEIGGLDRAIDLAIELAAGDSTMPIDVVSSDHGLLELLGVGASEDRLAAHAALERRAQESVRAALGGALLPFRPEIEAFAASAAPLMQGERLLVALPLVVAIR